MFPGAASPVMQHFQANKCNKHDIKGLSQRDECITMGLYAIAWRQKLDCLLAQCNQSEDPNPRNCTEMQIEQFFELPSSATAKWQCHNVSQTR